jgi:hypothetical protein
MAKATQRVVEFTTDFANKKTGEQFRCDGMLANQLVEGDRVARYVDVVESPQSSTAVVTEKPSKKKGK